MIGNVILFSKDRPSQLHLFIHSMKEYFVEFKEHKINILYTYSNSDYEKGYDKLKSIHTDTNINWIKENNFKIDLNNCFNKTVRYSTFFVDDNVFKEKFSVKDKEFKYFDDNKSELICLSLRLNLDLNWCYPARISMRKPNILHKDFNIIDWRNETGDYNYPLSLDGHIFLTKDILHFIESSNYNNPNSLESIMASTQHTLKKKKMIFYSKSKIFNIPMNKVQTYNNNIFGDISAETLNNEFLNDNIISLEELKGFNNTSCHQEVKINLIKL